MKKNIAFKRIVSGCAAVLVMAGSAVGVARAEVQPGVYVDVKSDYKTDVLSVVSQYYEAQKQYGGSGVIVAPVTGPSTMFTRSKIGNFNPHQGQAYLFSYAVKKGWNYGPAMTTSGQSGRSVVTATYDPYLVQRLSEEGPNRNANSVIGLNPTGVSHGKIIAPIYARGKAENSQEAGVFVLAPDMALFASATMKLGTRNDIEILYNNDQSLFIDEMQRSKTGGKSVSASGGGIIRGIATTLLGVGGISDSDQFTEYGEQTHIVGYVVQKEETTANDSNLIDIREAFPKVVYVVTPPPADPKAAGEKEKTTVVKGKSVKQMVK